MENKCAGVIGAGIMGTGIAQCFLEKGWKVVLNDINSEALSNSFERIKKAFAKAVNKQKMSMEQSGSCISRLKLSGSYADLAECRIIVEASVEIMSVKKEIFGKLEEVVSDKCILATNTSSLSITEIAEKTKMSNRVVGMHFFNPAPVMKLVEIIKGADTSEKVVAEVAGIVGELEKQSVVLNEAPGFIVNRLLVLMINEAACVLSEGVAEAKDIDSAMKLGCNHPLGPLALADMIGIDVILNVMKTFHDEFGDDKYRPNTMIKKLVRAGKLGRKTGSGFYEYKEA